MDSDDLERVLFESEENVSSDETSSVLDAPPPISLRSRIRKHLCFVRTKLEKVNLEQDIEFSLINNFSLFGYMYVMIVCYVICRLCLVRINFLNVTTSERLHYFLLSGLLNR